MGSVGGGLLLLVTITVTIVCLILQKYILSAKLNQRCEKSSDDKTTTENSVACKPVPHARSECQVWNSTWHQQSADNLTDSELDTEQNVACGSPTDHGDILISLKSNIAYYK